MAGIQIKRRWVRKPTHRVELDLSNSIARKATSALVFNSGAGDVVDLVSGRNGTINASAFGWTVDPHGHVVRTSNNSTWNGYGIDFSTVLPFTSTGGGSSVFVSIGKVYSRIGSSTIANCLQSSAGNRGIGLISGNTFNWNVSGASRLIGVTAIDPLIGGTIGIRYDSPATDCAMFVNGNKDVTRTDSSVYNLTDFHSMGDGIGSGHLATDYKFLLVFDGEMLSDDEFISLHKNPNQIFKPRTQYIPIAAAGGVNLVIQDATHAHTADNIALTQQNTLAVQDAAHAHSADNVVLTGIGVDLVIQDAGHAHTADNLDLIQANVLTIQDSTHAHLAANVALTQQNTLAIADALHAHAADNLTLSLSTLLIIQDGTHAHSADNLGLTQANVLAIASALHALSSDNVDLVQQNTLVIDDALHALISDNVTVSIPGTAVTPIERTYIIRHESRTYVVMPENRTKIIH